MPELTPAGKKAQEILTWAYKDPANNAQIARDRIAVLWGDLQPGRGRDEVGDVASQLSKLAGSVSTMSPETIFAQVLGSS